MFATTDAAAVSVASTAVASAAAAAAGCAVFADQPHAGMPSNIIYAPPNAIHAHTTRNKRAVRASNLVARCFASAACTGHVCFTSPRTTCEEQSFATSYPAIAKPKHNTP